jgi:hypothetical protein
MSESFAMKGAARYLKEKHSEEELDEVLNICRDLASDLSRTKGYLHPRALAAASSHIYLIKQGRASTLENSSAGFRISSATLREYLRTSPAANSAETASKMLENKLFGVDLREALKILESLGGSLKKKKNTINPGALAAASLYISRYKSGGDASLVEVAREFGISTSTLRDYVGGHDDAVDPIERAKILLGQYMQGKNTEGAYEILDKVGQTLKVSTARILAAISYYLYTIDEQRYVTIEKVARDFNVSIPALRSYLEPYLPSISRTYLLFKRGECYNIESALGTLSESEKGLLNSVYANFGTNIFELSLLFDIGGAPRGRWQLFVRKMSKLGLLDVYKKPLDPRQYCALVSGLSNSLRKPESLQRWV